MLCLCFIRSQQAEMRANPSAHCFVGVDNILTLRSFLPNYYPSTGAKGTTTKPIDTIAPYFGVYAQLGGRWHAPVHLGTWTCFAWALVSHPESRSILSLAFACEIMSMAVVPLVLQPMREVTEAKTSQAAEKGLRRLFSRMILRNLFCHTTCMLLSLYSMLV